MRSSLKKIKDVRAKFRGTFERLGSKINWNGYSEKTILLRNVCDEDGNIVTDHLWFNQTKAFEALGFLTEGDTIEFEARVTDYVKGYVNTRASINNRKVDYKLSRPTKMKVIKRP
jgi:hypothetical protein